MKRFLFFLLFAGLALGGAGLPVDGGGDSSSASYQVDGLVIGAASPLNATSASFNLEAVVGTIGGGLNAGNIADNNGVGFLRATVDYPQLLANASPSNSTCCGPFNFTSRWTDLAGRGMEFVYLEFNGTNYTANLSADTVNDGTWSGFISVSAAGNVSYRWYAKNLDGLLNDSASYMFNITAASSATPTPTPVVGTGSGVVTPTSNAATSSTSSSVGFPAGSGEPVQTGTKESPSVNFGQGRFGSSSVSSHFTEASATFTLSFTAGSQGFNGQLEHHLPFEFKDYQNGLVLLNPEPRFVRPGSIIAVYDLALSAGESFNVEVSVLTPVNKNILTQFKPPMTKPATKSFDEPAVVESVVSAVQDLTAGKTDSIIYYAIGGILLIGIVGAFVVFGRKKRK